MDKLNSRLIVNYIPQVLKLKELESIFNTVGPIHSCNIMRNFKTGYSYGFGFVEYANPEDAEKAIRELNGLRVYDKQIKVSYARPPGENIKDTNLYITNLPLHYCETDLVKLFEVFGTIVQKRILLDKFTGHSRGVAFVRFSKREEAQKAIQNLDGKLLEGRRPNEKLNVRVAEEHGKQRGAHYAGFNSISGIVSSTFIKNEMGSLINKTDINPNNVIGQTFPCDTVTPFEGICFNSINPRNNYHNRKHTSPFNNNYYEFPGIENKHNVNEYERRDKKRFGKKLNRFDPVGSCNLKSSGTF